jgi:hypothetical protein
VNNGYTETRAYDPAGRLTRVATTRASAPPALTLARYMYGELGSGVSGRRNTSRSRVPGPT